MCLRPEFEQTLGDSERTEEPGVLPSIRSQRVGHDLATEQQHKQLLSHLRNHISIIQECVLAYF